ncbi:MAG: TIGR00730 family Rossman fold protein [Bacteroidaceae bacterium]|nr:TIGR00730 family Rossman fold protein [Bacteroidaceae bacterium]
MNITVYAASSGQVPAVYLDAARNLGTLIAQRGHALVNGAGRTGLMGATTEGVLASGGRAIGVIPQFMVDEGWHNTDMSELIVTPDMHTRKQTMAEVSGACIALPGGVGTLEELLEIITWKQLGLYLKPIVVLNIDGYFNPLLEQLRTAVDQRFMRQEHEQIWNVATTPEEAIRLCEETPLWNQAVRKYAAL